MPDGTQKLVENTIQVQFIDQSAEVTQKVKLALEMLQKGNTDQG